MHPTSHPLHHRTPEAQPCVVSRVTQQLRFTGRNLVQHVYGHTMFRFAHSRTTVAVLLRRRRQCSRERCFACVTFASLSLSCIIVAVAPVAVAADAHARCCVRESNAVPGQHNLK